jgi:hypothetical protein
MDATTVEASVAAVREQVQSLVARQQRPRGAPTRVLVRWMRNPTPCWRITARFRLPHHRVPNVWFSSQWLGVDKERIVLPESNLLEIVGAGWKDETLTLCIAQAKEVLASAHRDIKQTNELLGLAAKTLECFTDPARMIAVTRAVRAVSKAIENASVAAIADAATASSDLEVVVRALQEPETIQALKTDDPLGPARLRGLRERERLLSIEGGTSSAEDVANHLNITRQAVNKRRQQGTLIGLDAGRHGYLYPRWQFIREGTLPGLEAVIEALEKHDPWMQHVFMVSPNGRLDDVTPLEALRSGRLDDVLKAALAFGEHGAA